MAAVRFGHNYNAVSRQALYEWFNEHLNLRAKSLDERPFERLTTDQMTVWDEQHPRPRGGDEFEVALLQHWEQDSRKQLAAAAPRDANSARGYREIVGGGIDAVIGRRLPRPAEVDYEQTDKGEVGNYVRIVGLLRNLTHQEELPVVFLYPKAWENRVVIWLDGRGKAGMYGDDGKPIPAVKKLLDQGVAVAGVDLFMQGEFLKDGKPVERTRRVGNPREAAAYSFGYNPTLFARRVHDALTAIAFVRAHEYTPEHVDIVVVNGAGPIGAAARAQARDAIDRAAIVTAKFRFAQVESIHSPNFLPGGAKYDDLPGMLAVAAPSAVWIGGEDEVPHVTAAAYKATGGKASLGREEGDKAIDEAVEWIVAGAQ
jgi:hypothetical protein